MMFNVLRPLGRGILLLSLLQLSMPPQADPVRTAQAAGGDFTISVAPTSRTVSNVASSSANYTLTLTSMGGYNLPVQLDVRSTPAFPADWTVTFTPVSVTPTTAGATSTLLLSLPARTAPGTYQLTVTGTGSDGIVHTVPATLVVQAADFQLSVAPTSRTVSNVASSSASYTLTLTSQGGYNLPVALDVSSTPAFPADWTVTFTPVSVTPTPTGATSTLLLSLPARTAPGTYQMTVTGTGSDATVHTVTATLVVQAADFTISVAPTSRTVSNAASSSASYTLTLTSQGGYNLPVTLDVTSTPLFPPDWTVTFTPVSVTPTPTGATTTLLMSLPARTAAGTYQLTVSGTGSDGTVHTVPATLVVQAYDFQMSVAPTSRTVSNVASSSASYTLTLTSQGGYNLPVTLDVTSTPAMPSDWTVSFTPPSVTPTATGATSTMLFSLPAAAAPGTYQLTVTGTGSDATAHTVVATLVVQAADFQISVAPASLTVPNTASTDAVYTVTLTAQGGYNLPVTLDVSSTPALPADWPVVYSPPSVTPTAAGVTSTLRITVPAGATPATYQLSIMGYDAARIRTVPATLIVSGVDFQISASPATQTVSNSAPSSRPYSVTVTGQGGYSSSVTLSVASTPPLPAGVTTSFAPPSVTPTAAGATSTLTVGIPAGAAPGTYQLTVTGTAADGKVHSTPVTLVITAIDFQISANPATQTVSNSAPSSAPYSVTVTGQGGYSSSVTLSVASAPPLPAGVTTSFAPLSVTPTAAGAASTLTVGIPAGAAPGTYQLTVTGTAADGKIHSTPVTLVITAIDFQISAGPATQTLPNTATGSAPYTLVMIGQGGYSSSVTLSVASAPPLPAGVTTSFAPPSVTPTAAGAASTLTVGVPAGAASGTYQLTVTGRGADGTVHSAPLTLVITVPGDFVWINGRSLTYHGQPVLLRGVNFDNGPALGLGVPGTPADITKINVLQVEYQTVAGWNANVVRFGMDYQWYKTNPSQMFATIDKHVQYAKAEGVWLMPTILSPPGGSNGGYQQYCLWSDCATSAANRQALVDFWRAFAQRYANEPVIVAYDILSEPNPPTSDQLIALGQQIRDAVTAVDPNHGIVFESGPSGLFPAPIAGTNVIYSDHHYAPLSYVTGNDPTCTYPGNCEGRLWNRTTMEQYIRNGEFVDYNFSVANNVPLIVGEFGAVTTATGYAAYDSDTAAIFNSLGVSWIHYTTRQASAFALYQCPTAGDMTCGDAGAIAALQANMGGTVRPPAPAPTGNPVVLENRQPGSADWNIYAGPPGTIADDVNQQIKGYGSATSVAAGQTLTFYVSVNPAQSYTISVYRLGWYSGAGGRLMTRVGPLNGVRQTACPRNATTGLIECAWSPGYTLNIPNNWLSGLYLAVLTNAGSYVNVVPFTVRDSRVAPLLYQQSVTTYQAYNSYPNDGITGKSLYEFNSFGPNTVAGTPRAVKVSFDRPYADEGTGQLFDNEVGFVQWLERAGYDVTYSTDVDTHANGARLLTSQAYLSVGHDEYWSKEMFDAAQQARDAGVNLGFFGANDVYWQVRFEPSSSNVANRVMVCYKDARIDPVQGPTTTVNFRDPPVNRPEQALMGNQFSAVGTFGQDFPYVVRSSGHWLYRGTGVVDNTSIPGIVGYEVDHYQGNFPLPAFRQWQLLSQSPFTPTGVNDYQNASMYQAPGGAWVFDAGTIDWGHGVTVGSGGDARIQQMTANILDTFTTRRTTTTGIAQVQAGPQWRSYSATVTLRSAAPSRAGNLLVAALANDGTATFSGPAGWIKGPSLSNGVTRSEIWYYPNNPGNISSATFTAPGGAATSGALSEWSGVSTTTPLSGSGAAITAGSQFATVSTDASSSGALTITAYSAIRGSGGPVTVTPAAGWALLATDGTSDWFHFVSDYSLAAPSGWVGETERASVPMDWSAVIATFNAR